MHVIVFLTCATGGFTGELAAGLADGVADGVATTLGGAGLVVTKVTVDFAQTSVVPSLLVSHQKLGCLHL